MQELISAVDAHPTSPEVSFFFKDELETKHFKIAAESIC
jgi:hypothetical protein